MIKPIRTIWTGFWLIAGVLLAASVTTCFLLVVAFPIGSVLALNGSNYWRQVIIAFDKLWNAILNGDHKETVSSRLGKSTIHGYPCVFVHIWIDRTVAWMLHQVDKHHCKKSIDWNVGRPRQVSV